MGKVGSLATLLLQLTLISTAAGTGSEDTGRCTVLTNCATTLVYYRRMKVKAGAPGYPPGSCLGYLVDDLALCICMAKAS